MTWLDRINRARKTNGFSDLDKQLAGKWSSCAVGEKLEHAKYTPDDLELEELGEAFEFAVLDNSYNLAELILFKVYAVKV
mgnify:CR=1